MCVHDQPLLAKVESDRAVSVPLDSDLAGSCTTRVSPPFPTASYRAFLGVSLSDRCPGSSGPNQRQRHFLPRSGSSFLHRRTIGGLHHSGKQPTSQVPRRGHANSTSNRNSVGIYPDYPIFLSKCNGFDATQPGSTTPSIAQNRFGQKNSLVARCERMPAL